MSRKLIADLSLDLDNQWAYLRTHGDPSWQEYPSYLPFVVPLILSTLERIGVTITVFVVGQDAVLEQNRVALAAIAQAGHELGNHSFHHQPWLQRYSRVQLVEEFERTEQALHAFTTQKLRGFRAPGYSLSADVIELLCERGYVYDCSTLPTYLGPAARAYYLLRNSFSREQKEDRKELFGSFADGFRSLRPYYWSTPSGEMLELPVSVIPGIRTPFHFSYLHFIAQKSPLAAKFYFAMALHICRTLRVSPSLLIHPLDFLGADDVPALDFFPGMAIAGTTKRKFMEQALRKYAQAFEVVTMAERAAQISSRAVRLKRVDRLPHRN